MNLPFFASIKLYLWSSFIAKVHWGHTETRSKPINKSNECQHNESEMWHRLRSRINIDLQTMPWGKWLCWSYCAETMLNLPAGVCSVHCHHQLATCSVWWNGEISKHIQSVQWVLSYFHFHHLSCVINSASYVQVKETIKVMHYLGKWIQHQCRMWWKPLL